MSNFDQITKFVGGLTKEEVCSSNIDMQDDISVVNDAVKIPASIVDKVSEYRRDAINSSINDYDFIVKDISSKHIEGTVEIPSFINRKREVR